MDFMVDLETMGNRPDAAIWSIGAVSFKDREFEEIDSFYERISLRSSIAAGLTMNADTILWWMRQDDNVRAEINRPSGALEAVLKKFAHWLIEQEPDVHERYLWAQGVGFDIPILHSAYDACGIDTTPLWSFWNTHDLRTLESIVKRRGVRIPEFDAEKHNALADAQAQLKRLGWLMNRKKREK